MKLKFALATITIAIYFTMLVSCSENAIESSSGYEPLDFNDGWLISTAEEQGVNPDALASAYRSAGTLDNIYTLLIIKNGYLIAEKYFNGKSFIDAEPIASVTKSVVSALTGIAIADGYLPGTESLMKDYFPEIDWSVQDPRKSQITIEQILQMRSGHPWEEFDGYLDLLFVRQNWILLHNEIPLTSNPGTKYGYSNFMAHMMGIIISRSVNSSLQSYAQNKLFTPLGVEIEYWQKDSLGYNFGSGDLYLTARDLAKFGLLFLNKGSNNNHQIVSEDWVERSFQIYSKNVYGQPILDNMGEFDYGYLWWASSSGNYNFNFAWGQGGQLVVLVHDLNMVIVATADNFPGEYGEYSWLKTKDVMEIVGRLIGSL